MESSNPSEHPMTVSTYSQIQNELDKLKSSIALIAPARRSIYIRSHILHRPIYADHEFVSQLSQFCRQNRKAKVCILINYAHDMIQNSHRLLDLAQRLSSFIEIRLCHKDMVDPQQEYIIVDQQRYLRWLFDNPIKAVMDTNDRARSKTLSDEFNALWQYASPASQLRRLGI